MEELDLYDVLQVPSTAGPEEIRRAYRALLRKHHPDMHKPRDGVEARRLAQNMAAIHHAYEVLSDPGRRAAYDRRRQGIQTGQQRRGRHIHVHVHRSGEVREERAESPEVRPDAPAERQGKRPAPGEQPEGQVVPDDDVRVVPDGQWQHSDEVRVVPDEPLQHPDEIWISPAWLRPRQDDAFSLFPDESPLRPPPDVFERLLRRWFFR
jgi:curved DNA-binding protein CbpA